MNHPTDFPEQDRKAPQPAHGPEVLRITLPCKMKAVADIGRLACKIWGKGCTFTGDANFITFHKPLP